MQKIEWYEKKEVLFEIVKLMRGREVVFIPMKGGKGFPIRKIKAHMVGYLQSNFRGFKFMEKDLNIYISLAKFMNLPLISFAPRARKIESDKWTIMLEDDFQADARKYVTGIDFGIDIDGEDVTDLGTAWSIADAIKSDMDKFKVPYSICFSGNKGFHIRVDDMYFLPDKSLKEKYEARLEINKKLLEHYGKCVDIKGIMSWTRVFKVPYSMDLTNNYIVLPLTDEQFEEFDLSMVEPENIHNIRDRGILERQQGLDTGTKVKNMNDFLDYVTNDLKKKSQA